MMLLLLLFMFVGTVNAQQNGTLQDVKDVLDVKQRLGIKTTVERNVFFEEINSLATDTSLYCIPKTDSVLVAALVCNEGGDYWKYWREKTQTDSNRYTWVFVPENFLEVCKEKGLLKNDIPTSERLCKLLGLGTDKLRDTIVYMKVPRTSLFRPAYVTDVGKTIQTDFKGKNTEINNLPVVDRLWMANEQINNAYPWTRMGYTYDWGYAPTDKKQYIGVTEFVIRPGTVFSSLGYVTRNNMKTGNGIWPGCE